MLFEVWELFGEIQRSTVLLLKCVTSISFFPNSSVGQETFCNAGDSGLIPGLGRSPEEGNGNPLQYSCLENPMDGGAWWVTVHGSQRVRHDWVTSLSLLLMDRCCGIKSVPSRPGAISQSIYIAFTAPSHVPTLAPGAEQKQADGKWDSGRIWARRNRKYWLWTDLSSTWGSYAFFSPNPLDCWWNTMKCKLTETLLTQD